MKNSNPAPKFGPEDYKDLAIIGSIKRGNKDAFSLLFKKYHNVLYQKMYFSVYNKEEAEDLMMELFEKVYENLDKYNKEYTFNTWLSRVATNFLIDYARKKKIDLVRSGALSIDRTVTGDDGSSFAFELPDNGVEDTQEKIEKQAKLGIIYKIISSLPDLSVRKMSIDDRKFFEGFHYNGKTPVELSIEHGVDLKVVEEKLKRCYERYDQGKLEMNIMKLYYVDDLSYDEICKKLKIKLNTMKVLLMRTKERIADMVDRRRAEQEIGNITSMDQLDIDGMYNIGG